MDNSVFISYRRNISGYTALAVFQDLHAHGVDAFVDHKSIPAGQFEPIILSQIASRPYFLVILAPGCLKRANKPGDWFRREIEYAMELDRIIIPLLTSDFDFKARSSKPYLTGKLETLPTYQAQKVPLEFFETAMEQLRTRFLKPIDLPNKPVPTPEQATARRKIEEANAEPLITRQQLQAQDYFEDALARSDEDLDGQINDLTEALRINSQHADAYHYRGNAYKSKGDLVHAISDYSEAIRFNPQDTEAYYNRGLAYADKGDFTHAVADYDAVLTLDPQHPEAGGKRELAIKQKQFGD